MDVDFELTFSLTWYIHVARVIQFYFIFFILSGCGSFCFFPVCTYVHNR